MGKDALLATVRKKWFLVVGCVLGGFLLMAGSLWAGQKKSATAEPVSVTYYTEALEKRIASLCASVEGVSDVHVLLTLECGSEYVYAQNREDNASGSSVSEYLIIEQSGDEAGVLVKEIYPYIRGVAVVCAGGGSAVVQQTLTELLSAALGIPSGKIRVAGAG